MILAVTGMKREAAILKGDGLTVVIGGGDNAALEARLSDASAGAAGIISIGIAGGLDPALKPGDTIVGSAVHDGGKIYATDAPWSQRLKDALPHARTGIVAGADVIAPDIHVKQQWREATGAAVLDMESYFAARIAVRRGLPFAVLRTVADVWDQTLPHAARVALKPDGGISYARVMLSILTRPGQIGELTRLAQASNAAFAALTIARDRLGSTLQGP